MPLNSISIIRGLQEKVTLLPILFHCSYTNFFFRPRLFINWRLQPENCVQNAPMRCLFTYRKPRMIKIGIHILRTN